MTSASDPPSSPVRVGQVVAGKYRVEHTLGIGGMGVVVAATHLSLDQRVALKFLRPESRENDEIVERFTREARSAAKIQSEHVGRVMDVGQLDSGDLYMVMEYLEGRDLADVLATDGYLSPTRAVELVLQACEAVAEAHAHGIVHRDLKPANLFLASRVDGSKIIKVLDFGISKVTLSRMSIAEHATDPSLTNPTAVMGSPLYMSPEQMHASIRVDARTDIWALGVILYELVSGKTPFEQESIPLIHAAILHNEPPPLAGRVKGLPVKLETIIKKCLEKEPAKRYSDVAELVTDLAPLAAKQGRQTMERVSRLQKAVRSMSDRPARMLAAPDPNAPSSTITSWEGRRTAFGPRRIVAIGAALFVVGAAATLFVARMRRDIEPGTPTRSVVDTAAATSGPATTAVPPAAPPSAAPVQEPAAPSVEPAPAASSTLAQAKASAAPPRARGAPPKPSGSHAPSAAPTVAATAQPSATPAPAHTDDPSGFGDRE